MKPILFNTEMVQAILSGTKTTTRRVVKPQFETDAEGRVHTFSEVVSGNLFVWADRSNIKSAIPLPYHPGDVLYVRETWRIQSAHRFEADAKIEFKAGGPMQKIQFASSNSQSINRDDYDEFVRKWWNENGKWHPSLFMPKEAARIFLRVTDIKAERLRDITNDGAHTEGIFSGTPDPKKYKESGAYRLLADHLDKARFADLWDTTVKKSDRDRYGWKANPWVWVISFERCEKV